MKEKLINWLIGFLKADTNKISDGYHTFEQLYDHRCELWMALCKSPNYFHRTWKSQVHSDGSRWNGWFILGIDRKKHEQITYHLPIKYWEECSGIKTLPKAPEFDGHTSRDVIARIRGLGYPEYLTQKP